MKKTTPPAAREQAGLARKGLAALTLSALALSTLALSTLPVSAPALAATATPAQAEANGGHSIRYASVKACKTRDGAQFPCGPWRLGLRGGRQVVLKDALVWPRASNGKTTKSMTAPMAVSGDGETVAYFRKSDGRVVVRELGGAVHVMPKIALPRGVGMEELDLKLSLDGGHLAVEYYDEANRQPTRVFDTSHPGKPGEIPGNTIFQGFSGDGQAVLAGVTTDDNTIQLVTYDTGGNELSRVEPPQVVANNEPQTLSSDGRTVAFLTGTGHKPALNLYDLGTDQIVRTIRFKLPQENLPYMLDWTGDHQITMHVTGAGDMAGAPMTILELDTDTGAVKVRDSYKMPKDAFTFMACGG
ncbi:hypothetical protein N5079_11635 [Planotetraspora sp. A-T 1434]|uniref:hypothetical protein n=1 Tax=Planotetraspora sp. A-T 1434 TaxID=2979219 RepID=UPI0021BFA0AC|nr:hypothetical protein [Planotetraspora sp. A-T 1434]MCT9930870.1 hypothetical protein [Planotetraspora sp. A-T 1434]